MIEPEQNNGGAALAKTRYTGAPKLGPLYDKGRSPPAPETTALSRRPINIATVGRDFRSSGQEQVVPEDDRDGNA